MLNQVNLVGRLTGDPEIKTVGDGKKVCYITLSVPRSFKNENGEYETDFIDCVLWDHIAENLSEWCKKGDLLGVKGRIQTRTIENKKFTEIIAEKVTLLSSKKEEKDGKAN